MGGRNTAGVQNKKNPGPRFKRAGILDISKTALAPICPFKKMNEAGWGKLALNPAVCGFKNMGSRAKKIPNRLASAVWDYEFLNNHNTALVPVCSSANTHLKPAGASWSLKPRRPSKTLKIKNPDRFISGPGLGGIS